MIGRSIQILLCLPAGRPKVTEGEDYWDEGNKGDTETMEDRHAIGTAVPLSAFAHTLYKSGQSFTFRRINFDQPATGMTRNEIFTGDHYTGVDTGQEKVQLENS